MTEKPVTPELVEREALPSTPSDPDPTPQYPPLPEGQRYVYNRMATMFEAMFNGRPYLIEPRTVRTLSAEIAAHLHAHSIIRGTLRRASGGQYIAERALALGPGWTILKWNKVEGDSNPFGNDQYTPEYVEAAPDATWLVPTDTVPSMEIFDQESVPNYVDRPDRDGLPTKRVLIPV